MRALKSFEEFIKEGIVKKVSADKERAAYLIEESERKFNQMQKIVKCMGLDEENANDYVESCYNIIMFLIRAKMLLQGYSSFGKGAHEAEVSFGKLLGISDADIRMLDQLRYFRNGILYYGKRMDKEYAEKIINYTKRVYLELKEKQNHKK